MNREYDFDGLIRSIIQDEMKYLCHYLAKVEINQDPDMKGKVLVTIPSLGWHNQLQGQWARPRQITGLSVPKVGEWVEVYFIDGKVHNLAYMGIAFEMMDMLPKNYLQPQTHVLFEAQDDNTQYTLFDGDMKKMTLNTNEVDVTATGTLTIKADTETKIDSAKITLNAGSEPFVLGTALDTWITNTLKIWTDTHLHPTTVPGANTGVAITQLTAPANYLSTGIKGK
jgi:hypothetical protein